MDCSKILGISETLISCHQHDNLNTSWTKQSIGRETLGVLNYTQVKTSGNKQLRNTDSGRNSLPLTFFFVVVLVWSLCLSRKLCLPPSNIAWFLILNSKQKNDFLQISIKCINWTINSRCEEFKCSTRIICA